MLGREVGSCEAMLVVVYLPWCAGGGKGVEGYCFLLYIYTGFSPCLPSLFRVLSFLILQRDMLVALKPGVSKRQRMHQEFGVRHSQALRVVPVSSKTEPSVRATTWNRSNGSPIQ